MDADDQMLIKIHPVSLPVPKRVFEFIIPIRSKTIMKKVLIF